MWENWINLNVEPTDKQIKEYFKYVYRGRYYVALKSVIAEKLRKQGYTMEKIGGLLGLDHSTIVFYINKYRKLQKHEANYIKENAYFWIQEGIYPLSETKYHYDGIETKSKIKINLTKL